MNSPGSHQCVPCTEGFRGWNGQCLGRFQSGLTEVLFLLSGLFSTSGIMPSELSCKMKKRIYMECNRHIILRKLVREVLKNS